MNDGKLPVRNCSCRGDAAGFAHLSCLIEYAKSKSKNLIGTSYDNHKKNIRDNRFEDEANGAWHLCPNCEHVESACRNDYGLAVALRVNIESISDVLVERTNFQRIPLSRSGGDDASLSGVNVALRDEAVFLLKRFMSWVSKELKSNKSIFAKFMYMPPTSNEYQMYKKTMKCDAYANERLGLMYNMDQTKENCETAVKYMKRTQVIFKMLHGCQEEYNMVTANVERTKNTLARLDGKTSVDHDFSEVKRKVYEYNIRGYGKNHDITIFSGIELSENLRQEKHGIEAQCLATKLSASCRQVLGPNHAYTKRIDKILSACKERLVIVFPDPTKPDWKRFNALRYEDDGDVSVLMGPIEEPRNIITKREFSFPRDNVLLNLGLPVSCHGLKNSSHLNGEVGGINHFYNAKTKHPIEASLILLTFLLEHQWFRAVVHFANKSLPPAAVKLENLRIVFDPTIVALVDVAVPAPPTPQRKTEEYSTCWTCNVCRVAQFPTYEDAVEHEKECTGLPQDASTSTI